MIKKLFLVAFMATLTQAVSAQVTVQRDYGQQNNSVLSRVKDNSERVSTFAYKFGLKAGVNLSNMSNNMDDVDPGFAMGTGFRAGGFVNLRWGQRTENSLPGTGWFGLQPEVMFSMLQYGTDADKINMTAVSVPVMVKIYPTTELSFEIGPEFNYILSTSPDYTAVNGVQLKTGDIKGMNVGVAAGVAYDFEMGLTLGARYSYGMNNMAKNLDWKTSNIQLTVGWMF